MTMTLETVVEPSATEAAALTWVGSHVVFSRPSDNQLLRFDPESGAVSPFRQFTGGVTGVASDGDGRVYGCQTSSRRVVAYEADGSTSVPATHLDGRLHNFPRYAAADRCGRVWFADPRLGLRPPGPQVFPLLDHASVLRLDPGIDGAWTLTRMTSDTVQPTVIALADDQSVLYVVDNPAGGHQELRAYPIIEGGLGPGSVLATLEAAGGPVTGMAAGPKGRVVMAGCGGILVATDDGQINTLATPSAGATDVAFGGHGGATLYVTTADGALLRGEVGDGL